MDARMYANDLVELHTQRSGFCCIAERGSFCTPYASSWSSSRAQRAPDDLVAIASLRSIDKIRRAFAVATLIWHTSGICKCVNSQRLRC
jgi:hypothetical protein